MKLFFENLLQIVLFTSRKFIKDVLTFIAAVSKWLYSTYDYQMKLYQSPVMLDSYVLKLMFEWRRNFPVVGTLGPRTCGPLLSYISHIFCDENVGSWSTQERTEMSLLGKLFGKSGDKAPTPQEAIQRLTETEEMLQKKSDFLEKKIEGEIATARKHGTKNKRGR